jgi:hypothetical protein
VEVHRLVGDHHSRQPRHGAPVRPRDPVDRRAAPITGRSCMLTPGDVFVVNELHDLL